MARTRRKFPAAALAFVLAVFASTAAWAERCREHTLPGAWRALGSGNIWTFHSDGGLTCRGTCKFVRLTGDPVSWAYEPNANIWAEPLDYIKLEFTKVTFDGVLGAFRCVIEDDGGILRLESEDDFPMVFRKVG